MSKAYGLYLGAREHPSSAVLDRGSKHRTGATVSSRMAQSRYGSAGELLAWRPDRVPVGHEALMGVSRGVTPGLWQGSAACTYNENSNAILESTSKRKNAKSATSFFSGKGAIGAPLSNHSESLGPAVNHTIGSGRAATCLLRIRSMLPPTPTQSCASPRRLVPRVQRPLCVQQQLRTTCQKMKPRSPRALLPLQSADGAASAAIGLPT